MLSWPVKTLKLFDSGWIDLTDYSGDNYTLTHNLNMANPEMIIGA
jgi:hypothetical protein